MNVKQWLIKYKFHHIVLWMLIAFFAFITYYNPEISTFVQVANALTTVGMGTIPFYFSAYVLVPKLLYKRKFVAFVSSLILLIISMGLLSLFVTRIVDHLTMGIRPVIPNWQTMGPSINLFIWNNILATFTPCALKILSDRFRIEKKLAEVEKEKIKTELSFLRSQVNPHFLFNVMNTIYFQIEKTNSDARLSVEKFSEMLRYQLYECATDKIQIDKELHYIRNYVAIQTLRMEEDSDIRLFIDKDMENFVIAPLLILPIVENAFKHVSNFKEPGRNKIHIIIKKEDNTTFWVDVINTCDPIGGQKHLLQTGGLGMNNLQRRLELLYPGKHELNINKEADTFHTVLKLQYDD